MELLEENASPLGRLTLERRPLPNDEHAIEILLNGYVLMSTRATVSEEALASLALAALPGDGPYTVLVGGLGLGYTAHAALADARVTEVTVAEYLEAVIEWNRRGLTPLSAALNADPRCHYLHADFFALMGAAGHGLRPEAPTPRYDAILLDIDHAPRNILHGAHGAFYEIEGLRRLTEHLAPGGVFGVWSYDAPGAATFDARLRTVFPDVSTHRITFEDTLDARERTHVVFIARTEG